MKHILEQWHKYTTSLDDGALLSEEEPYQKAVRLKHKRNRLTTKGIEKEEPPFDEDPPKERGKSAPPMEESEGNEDSEIVEGKENEVD